MSLSPLIFTTLTVLWNVSQLGFPAPRDYTGVTFSGGRPQRYRAGPRRCVLPPWLTAPDAGLGPLTWSHEVAPLPASRGPRPEGGCCARRVFSAWRFRCRPAGWLCGADASTPPLRPVFTPCFVCGRSDRPSSGLPQHSPSPPAGLRHVSVAVRAGPGPCWYPAASLPASLPRERRAWLCRGRATCSLRCHLRFFLLLRQAGIF